MANFGGVVRQLMERKSVTGVQLAQDIGITATSVCRLLNTKPPEASLPPWRAWLHGLPNRREGMNERMHTRRREAAKFVF